ncbi:uncharacterized protein BJ212DRAFT_1296254 [Suillus subaureus]|uniref:Uncharacterized protein n=1 Tax=Suillus subaureus TaxID=48587 RepID=A0A9P7EKG2_9AGAM|nr:uncharacterized protein BJ212DRAFT_1296254 [Suillus subaureus]KAG1823683.1 hypothetical protein BJ212DRAFT_1296254 [Suillus subaureus]
MTGRIAEPGKKNRKRTNAVLDPFGSDSRHLHFGGERWYCKARSLSTGQGIGVFALKIVAFDMSALRLHRAIYLRENPGAVPRLERWLVGGLRKSKCHRERNVQSVVRYCEVLWCLTRGQLHIESGSRTNSKERVATGKYQRKGSGAATAANHNAPPERPTYADLESEITGLTRSPLPTGKSS